MPGLCWPGLGAGVSRVCGKMAGALPSVVETLVQIKFRKGENNNWVWFSPF